MVGLAKTKESHTTRYLLHEFAYSSADLEEMQTTL
jgi:hypothetical protein